MRTVILRRGLVALFAAAVSFGAIVQAQAAETLRIGYQKYGTLVLLKAKGSLEKRLAERGLKLMVSDAAFDLLGNVGFDPVYGARPLKRAIQAQLENPLAQKILSGAFVNGDTIEVGNDGGHLVFAKA